MRFVREVAERDVRFLARRVGARIEWTEHGMVRYEPEEHRVYLRPIRSLRTYLLALHELGHATDRVGLRAMMDEENRAWNWARRMCLFDITPGAERMILRCLGTYAATIRKAGEGYG